VQVATADDVTAAQAEVRRIFVAESLQGYVYAIVARTRASTDLELGASPRATLALLAAAQAAAAVEGRAFATPDDVKSVAPLVLAHRVIVRPEAEIEGVTAERVVERILGQVEVPSDP
jgi:MoxR-like ATPase